MKKLSPALIWYFVACLLTVFAAYFRHDTLMLIAKPMIIPAISFYCLGERKGRFSVWYALFLFITFIGDTLVLMHFQNELMVIILPYALSYIVLLGIMARDVAKLPFRWAGVGIGAFVFALIQAIGWVLVQFFLESSPQLVIPITLYATILGLQCGLATYHFHGSSSNMSFYMAMTALFNCVSDIFYVLFSLILLYRHYLAIDLALQVFSYYFVIKYFIFRKR